MAVKKIDKEFNGFPPYFGFADKVIYITRGRRPVTECQPLSMEEWRRYIKSDPDLEADEVFETRNPHLDRMETWRELGRARFKAAGEPVWFHFIASRILHVHEKYPAMKVNVMYERLRAKLPQEPLLEEWLELVNRERYMVLQESFTDSKTGKKRHEPGRAAWVDRNGRIKHIFRYMPSSVWTYFTKASQMASGKSQPDPERLKKCREIARKLDANTEEGA